jgi:hypothetical protein
MKASARKFGDIPIHRLLTLEQLEQLKDKRSELSSDYGYVVAGNFTLRIIISPLCHVVVCFIVMERKLPKKTLDVMDVKEKEEFFKEWWDYVAGLPHVFAPVKALIWYHALAFEASQGRFDQGKFLKYCELPHRSSPHVATKWYNSSKDVHWVSFSPLGHIQAPVDEMQLCRDYVVDYFMKNNSASKFEDVLDGSWLLRTLAETKLCQPPAIGTDGKEVKEDEKVKEKWSNQLGPSQANALRNRVDIVFASENKTYFEVKDDVSLDVWVKNVSSLVVKVFKVNTRGYYRSKLTEVDAGLELDGLTAHEENTITYDGVNTFHRFRRTLTFASMRDTRGVFIVELLGNGKRARALIRKGTITFLEHPSAVGHLFRLFDESSNPIKGSIWIGDRSSGGAGATYESDAKTGVIAIPYTASPNSRQPMVITNEAGDFTTLAFFNYQSESYEFQAGLYVDRESLLQKSTSELVVKPSLFINGAPTSLDNIIKSTLSITSVNDEGHPTTQNIDDFKLSSIEESIHTFSVPDNLRTIKFTVSPIFSPYALLLH